MAETTSAATETAVLAGGCFWGMQDLIRTMQGVLRTRAGSTGGDNENPTYRDHGSHPAPRTGKVMIEVAPAGAFWEAEEEHEDYLLERPNGYTCHFVRPTWQLSAADGAAGPPQYGP